MVQACPMSYGFSTRAQPRVRRRPHGGLWRRSACRARAGGLTLGMVDRHPQGRALAQQGGTASSAVPGDAPRRGRHRGVRQHAAAQPLRQLVCIDRVVRGLAAVERVQSAHVTEDAGAPLFRTPVGQPMPGEETRDGHDEPRAGRGEGLARRCRGGVQSALPQDGGGWHVHGERCAMHHNLNQVDAVHWRAA